MMRLARDRLAQRGQVEPERSLMEQMVGPHGLLNPGKKA